MFADSPMSWSRWQVSRAGNRARKNIASQQIVWVLRWMSLSSLKILLPACKPDLLRGAEPSALRRRDIYHSPMQWIEDSNGFEIELASSGYFVLLKMI